MIFVDGEPRDSISALDRGLAYGDGVFETMRVVRGAIPLLDLHLDRLRSSLNRLAIPWHEEASPLRAELVDFASKHAHGVIKLIVTRGIAERGYAPNPSASPTRIVMASPFVPSAIAGEGTTVRICTLRLAEQPHLAGMKHLNRLEQVLARAEWSDPSIGEGLCLDAADRVICATAANLFAVIGGTLVTPSVERCGVAGVARRYVLEHEPAVVRDMLVDELEGASEVFLSNAVRGIVPVTRIDRWSYQVGPVTRRATARFVALGFGATP